MVITFCGHSNFIATEQIKNMIMELLSNLIKDNKAVFFLGGYGSFDSFAYNCCAEYKKTHPCVSLVFVTPYLTPEYQKKHFEYQKGKYDEIIYPAIEYKPRKYAISYRNKYMIEAADCVIAYVDRDYGGAYQTLKHAKRKGKIIFNLAQQNNLFLFKTVSN